MKFFMFITVFLLGVGLFSLTFLPRNSGYSNDFARRASKRSERNTPLVSSNKSKSISTPTFLTNGSSSFSSSQKVTALDFFEITNLDYCFDVWQEMPESKLKRSLLRILARRVGEINDPNEVREWIVRLSEVSALNNTCLLYTSPSPRD